jgi:hypothetical protein
MVILTLAPGPRPSGLLVVVVTQRPQDGLGVHGQHRLHLGRPDRRMRPQIQVRKLDPILGPRVTYYASAAQI